MMSTAMEWEITSMFVEFISRMLPSGEWENEPESAFPEEKWSFDLNTNEGIRASEQVSRFGETGWNVQ